MQQEFEGGYGQVSCLERGSNINLEQLKSNKLIGEIASRFCI